MGKLAKAEKRPLSPVGAAEKAIKKAKNTAMERAYKGKTLIVPRKKHKWSKKKLSPADPGYKKLAKAEWNHLKERSQKSKARVKKAMMKKKKAKKVKKVKKPKKPRTMKAAIKHAVKKAIHKTKIANPFKKK